jgi:hypothetical protein
MASRNISFGLAAFPRLDDLRPVAYPHISSALDARDSIESAPRSYGSVGNIANEVGSERSSIIDRHRLHRIRSCASEPQAGVVLRRVSTARNEYGVAAMLCLSAAPASASLAASRSMIISSQGITSQSAPGRRRSRDQQARLRYSSTFWAECPTRRTAVARASGVTPNFSVQQSIS